MKLYPKVAENRTMIVNASNVVLFERHCSTKPLI